MDREQAARFGADVSLLGQAVQLLTQGITVADYRPGDADGALDIRVRFPGEERSLAELGGLRVPTAAGLVPIENFVTFAPVDRVGVIRRVDERRVVTIEADVAPGVLPNDRIVALQAALDAADLPDGVTYAFAGEAEDQAEAMTFLVGAFVSAIFLMLVILVIQFNSFAQAGIVMTAIVFSIAGVLLGLLVTGRPFGVVMGGIGVIALAGIVVNNNIVLIDTFNALRREGRSPLESAMRAGAQRARPVLLTSVTTALGLMPMVVGAQYRLPHPGDRHRRALDAMVDRAVGGHRGRPRGGHRAHLAGHARDADADRQARRPGARRTVSRAAGTADVRAGRAPGAG